MSSSVSRHIGWRRKAEMRRKGIGHELSRIGCLEKSVAM
jgi:hypothetical protein